MDFEVKRAELGDDKKLMELEARCFRIKYERNFIWFWKPFTQHAYVYKAIFDKKIVGGILAFPTKHPGTIYIESIFVDTKFRDHGVATRLIEKVSKHAGCRELILDTMPGWKNAINLYRKQGFRVVKKLKNYYEDGTDRVLMVKRLR